MKFDELLTLMDGQGWFDLATVVQLSGHPASGLVAQLHRWIKAGRLVSLRRGMYAFAEKYRRTPIHATQLANRIYAPSYLSIHWALGFYGLIPEKVVAYTSVTSRVPKNFTNDFGVFTYRHLKPSVFFGYRRVLIDGAPVLLAEPEKALLDFLYLEPGSWGRERLLGMRFQNMELVKAKRLAEYADRFGSPRVTAGVSIWCALASDEKKGTVEL
jgi:predicted transcriptional regulator of viral defense system